MDKSTLINAAKDVISKAEQDYVQISYNPECSVAFAQKHNDVAFAKCQYVVQIMDRLIKRLEG